MTESPQAQPDVFAPDPGPARRDAAALPRSAIQRPLVYVALGWMAGLVIGRAFAAPSIALAAAAAAMTAVALALRFRRRARPTASPAADGLLLGAIVILGWMASLRSVGQERAARALAGEFGEYMLTRVEGRLAGWPEVRGRSIRFIVDSPRLDSAPRAGAAARFPLAIEVDLLVPEGDAPPPLDASLRPGSTVVAWGELNLPPAASFPGDFDRAAHLAGRSIGAVLRLQSIRDVEAVAPPPAWRAAVERPLAWTRRAIGRNLDANLAPRDAAIARAILLGDRSRLDPETSEAFRRPGLSHLLVVSGLHTGIVVGIFLFLARLVPMPARRGQVVAAVVGWIALFCFTALTEFRPSVARAALMGAVLLGGWAFARQNSGLSALAAAALLTLVWDPRNLIRMDWQFSYGCVASILILARPLEALAERNDPTGGPADDDAPDSLRRRIERFARRYALLPLAIVAALALGLGPMQAHTFHRSPLLGGLANVIGIPLTILAVGGSILLGAIGGAAPLAAVAWPMLSLILAALRWTVNLFGDLPGASIAASPLPAWGLALYYGCLLLGSHLRPVFDRDRGSLRWPRRRFLVARVALCLAIAVVVPRRPNLDGEGLLQLFMLDVGQGEAIVLALPDGRVGVIDGGRRTGAYPGGSDLVVFLERLGVERVDFAVASHADADHVGGLVDLARSIPIGRFIEGPDRSESGVYAELREELAARGVPLEPARAGMEIAAGRGWSVRALNPWPGQDDNDASVVLLIDYGDIEILLTGDIEAAAERRVIAEGLARDIDVLVVAHHGSASSSEPAFLDAFAPEIALISVGRSNPFGHPAPAVIDRLDARRIWTLRTDRLGTIRLTTDGRTLDVDRYRVR